jgi:hypothetical protein
MEIVVAKGAELIVLSTAGLDPMGFRRVNERIEAFRVPCATIDIRSASVTKRLEERASKNRLIHVKQHD